MEFRPTDWMSITEKSFACLKTEVYSSSREVLTSSLEVAIGLLLRFISTCLFFEMTRLPFSSIRLANDITLPQFKEK